MGEFMFHQQLALLITLGLAACAAGHAPGSGAAAQSGTVDNPDDDEDLRHIMRNPPTRLAATPDCIATSPDGTTQNVSPLHITPGTALQCMTIEMPSLAAKEVMASTGDRWCLKSRMRPETAGLASSNDSRVTWSLQTPVQPGARWTITGVPATAESFDLQTANFFGADVYPVFAEVGTTALELRPNPTTDDCDNVFAQ
jgi:hypothetical protein